MGSADAAWLHMDRPTNLMVINGVLWFDRPADWAGVRTVLQQRLVDPYPRFRQRVAEPTLGLGVPQWEDDEDFDLDLHLHHVALPAPGGIAELEEFVADRMVVPLDRSRPLWEFHLIDGYGDGAAMLARMHHAIADGIALARVLLSLTDEAEAGDARPIADSGPASGGGPLRGVLRPAGSALRAGRSVVGSAVHEGLQVMSHPRHTIDLAAAARDGSQSLAKVLFTGPDAETVLRGELGVAERVAWSPPLPLDDVKDLAHATGSTVNDILVTALTGALRDYLESRDSLVDEIRATVPFNLRAADEPLPRDLGNRFGLVTLPLPVGLEDPADRLAAVCRGMAEIKQSPEGPIAYAVLSALGTTPVQLESVLLDLFSRVGSTVVTNVPGPPKTVYLAGSPVRGVLVWAPVAGGMAMSISIISYAGEVTVGVMSDAACVPDPGTIVAGFSRHLELLREAVGAEPG